MYCSLQYITFTSCNVVVLRRIILYCNVGRHIKDDVVHRSRQQSLIAKWLGLGVTVRVRVRAREWNYFFFFFLCVKVTKTFVLLSWHVTVQCSDVRPAVRDVMMMYSKERYMENLSAISLIGAHFLLEEIHVQV